MTSGKNPKAQEDTYHHGDLRQALVEGALALLDERRSWDFSLREVARRIGVSHNAPYWHFADKDALLAAVAAAGFRELRAHMIAAAGEDRSAQDALAAIGLAYVLFGTERIALYRLMFDRATRAFDGAPEELASAAANSRDVLIDTIRRGAQEGSFNLTSDDARGVRIAVLAAWSMVHGLTSLYLEGLATLDEPRPLPEILADVSALFRQGLSR